MIGTLPRSTYKYTLAAGDPSQPRQAQCVRHNMN